MAWVYYAVMPLKRRQGDFISKLDTIPPGRFSFIDAKDVKENVDFGLGVFEVIKSKLNRDSFLFHCQEPSGDYNGDRRFFDQYVFDSRAEAEAKIVKMLKAEIRRLQKRLDRFRKS